MRGSGATSPPYAPPSGFASQGEDGQSRNAALLASACRFCLHLCDNRARHADPEAIQSARPLRAGVAVACPGLSNGIAAAQAPPACHGLHGSGHGRDRLGRRSWRRRLQHAEQPGTDAGLSALLSLRHRHLVYRSRMAATEARRFMDDGQAPGADRPPQRHPLAAARSTHLSLNRSAPQCRAYGRVPRAISGAGTSASAPLGASKRPRTRLARCR